MEPQNKNTPIFEKERSPNFKYKSLYALELYKHIMGGGSFESFICGEPGKPPITRATKYNWLKDHPEFAHARELAESQKQADLDRTITAGAFGIVQREQRNAAGELIVDPSKQNTKLLMFLAKTRYRKTYSERSEVALSNPDGSNLNGPTFEDLKNLSDEELDQYIALQRKIEGMNETPTNS